MAYRLEISKAAQKDDIRHLALKGDLSGLYKLRIGKYRVIYDLRTDIQVIVVIRAGKRSDVYRPKN
jgi:mRNA interferase RelE/StbE